MSESYFKNWSKQEAGQREMSRSHKMKPPRKREAHGEKLLVQFVNLTKLRKAKESDKSVYATG